jgi:hypothetical protein
MISIPKINPLTFTDQSNNGYIQIFDKKDIISLQIQYPFYDTTFANIIDCYGINVGQYVFEEAVTLANGNKVLTVDIPLWNIDEGLYHMIIDNNTLDVPIASNYFEVKKEHEYSKRIIYKHRSYSHDVYWEHSTFMIRVQCDLVDYTPLNKAYVYEDQPMNLTLVSGTAYNERVLYIGSNGIRISDGFAEKINNIFMCDTIRINDVDYTITEGSKLEPTRIEESAIATYKIRLRESKIELTTEFQLNNGIQLIQSLHPLIDEPNVFFITEIQDKSGNTEQEVYQFFESIDDLVNYLNSPYYVYKTKSKFFKKGTEVYIDFRHDKDNFSAFNLTFYDTKWILQNQYDFGVVLKLTGDYGDEPFLTTTKPTMYSQWDLGSHQYTYSVGSSQGNNPSRGPNHKLYICFEGDLSAPENTILLSAQGDTVEYIKGYFGPRVKDIYLQDCKIARIANNLLAFSEDLIQFDASRNVMDQIAIDEAVLHLSQSPYSQIQVSPIINDQIPMAYSSTHPSMTKFKNNLIVD